MRNDRLFFDTNILIDNEELILLPDGVFLWKKIVSFLEDKFHSIGYYEIYSNNLLSYVKNTSYYPTEYYSFEHNKNEIKLNSYGKYLNEIEECRNISIDILEIYNLLGKDLLAIPFLMGKLPFNQEANILTTYLGNKDVESSYLGKSDDVYFNHSEITTNIIYTVLNLHKDDNGLVMPPRIAPHQIAIVPLKQNEKGVLKECRALYEELLKQGFRVVYNDSNKITSNDKKEFFIKSGVPLIIEIGPRDLERNIIEVTVRDNFEKIEFNNDDKIFNQIDYLLEKMHKRMYRKILINNVKNECVVLSLEDLFKNDKKIHKVSWCGEEECLKKYQNNIKYISFNQQQKQERCLFCTRKSKYVISIIKN